MSRGFGTVKGVGTTDVINSGLTTNTAIRSWHIWAAKNGNGGAGFGFLLSSAESFYTEATKIHFDRAFSTTAGAWTITYTQPTDMTWHRFGVSYDGTATANNPVMYVDGTSRVVTRVTPPVGNVNTGSGIEEIGNTAGIRNWDYNY